MTSQQPKAETAPTLQDMLENLLAPIDRIEQIWPDGPHTPEARDNADQIAEALQPFMAIAHSIVSIDHQLFRLRTLRASPNMNETAHEIMTDMLASLEKLAFRMNQDQWALSHGFQKPQPG